VQMLYMILMQHQSASGLSVCFGSCCSQPAASHLTQLLCCLVVMMMSSVANTSAYVGVAASCQHNNCLSAKRTAHNVQPTNGALC
jgi:hypothetical protein